jgi:hypothetical protein
VTSAYNRIAINAPHRSRLQSEQGTAVDWRSQPRLPDDLTFDVSMANPTVISHIAS